MAKTNIMIINPMNPDIGYIIPTKFEKPNLANGRASMQNNPVSNSLFFFHQIPYLKIQTHWLRQW